MFRHKEHILALHKCLLLTLILAVVSSAGFLGLYVSMNKDGKALCCPRRPEVIFVLVLDHFLWTAAQTTLLLTCQGES